MLGVVVVYAGLAGMVVGAASLIKPLWFLGVRTKKVGLLVLGAGLVLCAAGMALPAELKRAAARASHLDDWMPAWQFNEFHALRVRATPEQAYRAIRQVTADEIFLWRTLTWIRHPRLPGTRPDGILNPSEKKPIMDEALAGGFRLLAEEPPREIVLATLVIWDGVTLATDAESLRLLLSRPGNALATINFLVRDEGSGWCTVTTETRVFATDDSARRKFATYWRVIYPGSSLLRYTWLRAIRNRAEQAGP